MIIVSSFLSIEHEGMEGLSTSWGYCLDSGTTKGMIEQAKEELQILEAQEPNRFNCLKLELKSFISHLESQNSGGVLFSSDHDNNMNMVSRVNSTCYSITTQESSAGKKRKKGDSLNGQTAEGKNVVSPKHKYQRVAGDGRSKRKGRIDQVFERAQECLQKIQQLKTSFS